MVAVLQRLATCSSVCDFHGYAKFCSNATNARFPPLDPCHLRDELLLISATEASFRATVLQLTLRQPLSV